MITTEQILQERGSRYGEFEDVAKVTQALYQTLMQTYYTTHGGQAATPLPAYTAEALHMICNKLARIVCGDPSYRDNYVDISGYAVLVDTILAKQEAATVTAE